MAFSPDDRASFKTDAFVGTPTGEGLGIRTEGDTIDILQKVEIYLMKSQTR